MSRLACWLVVAVLIAAGSVWAQPPAHPPVGEVPSGDGTLRGRVVREDPGASNAGLEVVLYALPSGKPPSISRTTTDADGRFVFAGISSAPDTAYLVGVRVGEIPSGARATFAEGQREVEVELRVSEPSDETAAARRGAVSLRFARGCGSLRIFETWELRNPTSRALYVPAGARAGATPILRTELPPRAGAVETRLGTLPEGIEQTEGELRFWGPLHPGTQTFEFSYSLPAEGGTLLLERGFPEDAGPLLLLAHVNGAVLRGERLEPAGTRSVDGAPHDAFRVAGIGAGERIAWSVELPPAAPAELELARTQISVELDDAALQADEQHRLRVAGDSPLRSESDAPLLCLELPAGAEGLRFSSSALTMGLQADAPGRVAVRGPIPAGESSLSLRYRLPVRSDPVSFERSFPLPLPLLTLLVADTGIEIETTRLHRRRTVRSDERNFLHLEGFQFEPGERVQLTFSRLPAPRPLARSVAAGFALLTVAGAVVFLAAPLRSRGEELAAGESRAAELAAEREGVYKAIRDIDEDFETGKLTAEDHGELRLELRTRAVRLLQAEREAARQPAPAAAAPPPAAPPAAAPAAAPADSRRYAFCPGCGERLPPGANFCPYCGQRATPEGAAG
jgi:hypothetical protein